MPYPHDITMTQTERSSNCIFGDSNGNSNRISNSLFHLNTTLSTSLNPHESHLMTPESIPSIFSKKSDSLDDIGSRTSTNITKQVSRTSLFSGPYFKTGSNIAPQSNILNPKQLERSREYQNTDSVYFDGPTKFIKVGGTEDFFFKSTHEDEVECIDMEDYRDETQKRKMQTIEAKLQNIYQNEFLSDSESSLESFSYNRKRHEDRYSYKKNAAQRQNNTTEDSRVYTTSTRADLPISRSPSIEPPSSLAMRSFKTLKIGPMNNKPLLKEPSSSKHNNLPKQNAQSQPKNSTAASAGKVPVIKKKLSTNLLRRTKSNSSEHTTTSITTRNTTTTNITTTTSTTTKENPTVLGSAPGLAAGVGHKLPRWSMIQNLRHLPSSDKKK